MPAETRITQRAPLSCQQCSRRKLKCSKDIPCSACVARGRGSDCRRETVRLSKHLSEKSSLGQPGGSLANTLVPADVTFYGNAQSSHSLPDAAIEYTTPDSLVHDGEHIRQSQGTRVEGAATPLGREVATSLECLVWGSHLDSTSHHRAPPTSNDLANEGTCFEALSPQQEQVILAYHKEFIAWLHNVVHLRSFEQQCARGRNISDTPATAWQALYYALMAAALYHMTTTSLQSLGLDNYTARTLYWKSIDALHFSDFMSSHTLEALQAICILVPCAHAYGDSKRIIALLASASCIAQMMQLHTLEDAYHGVEPSGPVQHEVKKRIWCFLVIQDSYLITFKKTYSICLDHARTPAPLNCHEDIDQPSHTGFIRELPLTTPTQTTYMLLQLRLVNIRRDLHEHNYQAKGAKLSLQQRYQHVLDADAQLDDLRHGLPAWVKCKTSPHDALRSVQSQWRTFRISYAHMKLSIHRAFFCQAFSDRRFYFSHVTCLSAARMILQIYQDTTTMEAVESWTIPPHVISACIIITLNLLLSFDKDDFDVHLSLSNAEDERLMLHCLDLIAATAEGNTLVKRGGILIHSILDQRGVHCLAQGSIDKDRVAGLVREIEGQIQADGDSISTVTNLSFEEFLDWFSWQPLDNGI